MNQKEPSLLIRGLLFVVKEKGDDQFFVGEARPLRKTWMFVVVLLFGLLALWQAGLLDFLWREDGGKDPGDSDLEYTYNVEVVAEGLEIPWEIAVLPDGKYLVTERPGRVILLGHGTIHTVTNVARIGEAGLLGLTLSPTFSEDRHVFLYYTYSDGNALYNRVSRFTFEETSLKNETILLDRIPAAQFHNGGRLKFGPDQKLYITTGDALTPDLSQDLTSLSGKILRMNADGSVPEDNPFNKSLIYAYGFRNPQGLAWHPVNGDLFASDHGPSSQDEINLVKPGMNYGWPLATCKDGETQYEEAVACYTDFTMAPSGIAFLPVDEGKELPLFVGGLRGERVLRLDLDDASNLMGQEALLTEYGRIRTVVYQDGSLYIANNNRDGRGDPREKDDVILKVTPVIIEGQ